jgi:glycine/D-amino acid oxidase-like deaminating enzyme
VRVIVVGGGIVGLSVAWGLHRRGIVPVVYEQGPIPNPHGASSDSSRLIRYTYGERHGYARLVREAYEAFELLWLDLGRRHHFETGTLVLARNDRGWVAGTRRTLEALRVPFEDLAVADLRRRFPMLEVGSVEDALLTPTGGVLLADLILRDLAAYLRHEGLAVQESTPVTAIDPARAAVGLADGREDQGDRLVIAAGPWSSRLVPGLTGRVTPSRQVALELEPPDEALALWQRAPIVLDDLSAARGFYAVPPFAGRGIKIGDHSSSMRGDPDEDRLPTEADTAPILALARERLTGADAYRPGRARTCFYSMTADQRFLALAVERALVLAGFSGHGFKFGPVLGLAAARMLDGDMTPEDLAALAACEATTGR